MYAAGTSKDALAFNCVQRGHQQARTRAAARAVARVRSSSRHALTDCSAPQALETFPTFLAVSLLGGLRHPYLVTLAGGAWIAGRLRWAACYAADGPAGRYGSVWSRFIWYGLVVNAAATVSFALGLAGVL